MKLKKYLILIFVMGLMAFGSVIRGDVDVQAEKITTNGFEYVIESNSITITDYVGNQRDVIIPSVIDGYPVKKIGNQAFQNCDYITNITIPDGVTIIGDEYSDRWTGGPFQYCSNLSSITIPDSVTSIGSDAFGGCTNLSSITIPGSVTRIGKGAFVGLSNIVFANGCTKIDLSCTSLTSITIPDSVTSINLSGCTSLTSITIPDGVTSINLSGCTSLTSITIPDSVTSINLSGCTSLSNISIPDGVTSINLSGCTSLSSITIPDSVTRIEAGAFEGCVNLTNITIPDSVLFIGMNAFNGCTSLSNITIPDSVISIDGGGYSGAGYGAFSNCTSLTNITIPNSVSNIGVCAFSGCTSLTSITIPSTIVCKKNFAEDESDITRGMESIAEGCTNLTNITVTSPDSGYYYSQNGVLFSREPEELVIYPQGKKGTYTIPDGIVSIGTRAFANCTNLTNITIPNSVTSFGDNSFEGCTGLTSVTIPNSVTSFGDNSFEHCTGLTSITIPDSVTNIGNGAFWGCSSLNSITIPDSVTNIGNDAFWGCSSLNSITIPDSVTSIEAGTFYYCTNLTSITIPNSVTRIEYHAFEDCDAVIYFTGTEDEWKKTHDIYIKNTVYFINDTFPDQITLDNTELTLYVYDEYAPHVTLTPSDVTVSKIYWKSSAPDIASCTEDGTIIAWKEGTATITAVTANGISASVNVTILASPEDSCEISGHTEYTNYGYPATCITTGLTDGTYCSVCGEILATQEEIPALGHSWGVWSTVTPPTVTSEGQRMRTCTICLTSEIQTIPRLGTEPPVPDTPSVENPSTHTPTPSRTPTTTLKLPLIKARPAQVGKVTAKNKKKRTLDLSWKKTANTNGYEIQYSTSKKFKSAKKKLTKKTKTTIKNLKKKTYYIRIRSFMYDGNNKKLYSKWSTVRKIRIKK